jgi:iron(III) transport system substrate-binding protein
VADRFNFFVIAYNTKLVKADEVPNTYQDLLHPRWAGKIGIEAGGRGLVRRRGERHGRERGARFFSQACGFAPQMRSGHTLMAELVSAGEVPLAATVYNHNAERLKVKGAPIDGSR